METQTITNEINNTIDDIYKFIKNNEKLNEDFTEYTKTMGIYNLEENKLKEYYIPYIFERCIPDCEKSPLKLFNENFKNDIANAMQKSFTSIFEVKKTLKSGFEVYNVINEKTYTLNITGKMTDFRGIGTGHFIVARVFEFHNEFYIIEMTGYLASSKKDDAMRYAMAKILQEPYLVYEDNQLKEQEIKNNINQLADKFQEAFQTDEIVTTSNYADEIIGQFNDFTENGTPVSIKDKIQIPQVLKFFEITELENNYSNFVENSLQGFSSHKKIYDVGIIYDKEYGLFVVPFYKTVLTILEENSLENIEGAKDCIKYYLTSENISSEILKRIYSKYNNLVELVNSVMDTNYTFEEILSKYKKNYQEHKIYSQTSVLYNSKVFGNTINDVVSEQEKPQFDFSNVGRNDPCPCGSGKKFKKCCGK